MGNRQAHICQSICGSQQTTDTSIENEIHTVSRRKTKKRSQNPEYTTIYKSLTNACFGKQGKVDITRCDHLQRILHGLRHYSSLKLDKNPSKIDTFIEFCDTVYSTITYHINTFRSFREN